ncbi:MAG: four helix bundle protein [Candidatus Marinimicrobia bacterium]|nr:four helix bundle protein [Candidatus Neomarinimicrobiota bacterium]
MKKKDTVREISYQFALKIIKLTQNLQIEKKEYIISKQLLKSGTSVGACIRESQFAESSADFIHKLAIALKEANESEYWLSLLIDSGYYSHGELESIVDKNISLIKMLTAIIKTKKKNLVNDNH